MCENCCDLEFDIFMSEAVGGDGGNFMIQYINFSKFKINKIEFDTNNEGIAYVGKIILL